MFVGQMRFELMTQGGEVSDVSADVIEGGAAVLCDGTRFGHYASFGDVHAFCEALRPTQANVLEAALPLPLGEALYPSPVVWMSTSGLAHVYRIGARRAEARGVPHVCIDVDDAPLASEDDNVSRHSLQEWSDAEDEDDLDDVAHDNNSNTESSSDGEEDGD